MIVMVALLASTALGVWALMDSHHDCYRCGSGGTVPSPGADSLTKTADEVLSAAASAEIVR